MSGVCVCLFVCICHFCDCVLASTAMRYIYVNIESCLTCNIFDPFSYFKRLSLDFENVFTCSSIKIVFEILYGVLEYGDMYLVEFFGEALGLFEGAL